MSAAPNYRIDVDRGIVHLKWGALTSLQEWTHLVNALTADPRFRRGYSIVEDLRGQHHVASQRVLDDWLQLLEAFAPHVRPCRWAVVFPPVFLTAFDQVRGTAERLDADEIDLCAFLDFQAALYWAGRQEGTRRFKTDTPG